ncbi:MAG: hypothetical protein DDT22_01356 [candidate division WS2 bacterium]|nr:hypothetical protein [Candidatus Lithacetigena glycinireducens]
MVVEVGETDLLPDRDTSPISGFMMIFVAFVLLQLKVAVLPLIIDVGEIDAIIVGGGCSPTLKFVEKTSTFEGTAIIIR